MSLSLLKRRQCLNLHILPDTLNTRPPSDTALLDPAIRQFAVDTFGAVRVDEHRARTQLSRKIGCTPDIPAPNRSAKTIDGCICTGDGIVHIAIRRDRYRRTELLLHHQRRIFGNVADDGGLHKMPAAEPRFIPNLAE